MQGPVALICPEPIRERMQGIGIRFWEMAELLRKQGHQVMLWVPNEDIPPEKTPGTASLWGPALRRFLKEAVAVVLHGHISEIYFDLLRQENLGKGPPLVVDLYDPFLVENLQYTPLLGDDVFYRDRSVLFRQLLHGDFFLASSEAQRLFYIGIMVGLGRLDPNLYHEDPTLREFIDVASFGVHPLSAGQLEKLPGKLKGVIPGIGAQDIVVFFGGVYDWYDPMILLKALKQVVDEGWPLRIIFCLNPNPETTPQKKLMEVRRWADALEWTGRYVFFLPWFPYEDRFHYYRDVDIAVSLHRPSLETDLSFRTRLLDFLNAGLPVVVTEGGEGSQKVREAGCGVLVRPNHREDLREAFLFYLKNPDQRRLHGERGRQWVQSHLNWQRALEPLMRFCANPRKRPSFEATPAQPTSLTPPSLLNDLQKFQRHVKVFGWKATLRRGLEWCCERTRHGGRV